MYMNRRSVDRGFYYRVLWRMYELCNNGRWVTARELMAYFPELAMLDEKDKEEGRMWPRGTARLCAALYWLEKKGLIKSRKIKGRRKEYRPAIKRERLLERILRIT